MTVYLDLGRNKFRNMVMCHMIADTEEELHAMAERIGLRREWYQAKASTPHYDVCLSRRREAVALGAVVLARREFVAVIQRLRNSG